MAACNVTIRLLNTPAATRSGHFPQTVSAGVRECGGVQWKDGFNRKRDAIRMRTLGGASSEVGDSNNTGDANATPFLLELSLETIQPTNLRSLLSFLWRQLQDRWRATRHRFFLKLFVLLWGFFSANALSTIVGQTGDWDVLVAGLLVAGIELLGAAATTVGTNVLPPDSASASASAAASAGGPLRPALRYRLQAFMQLANLWKAGIIFGLFTDAFKVGS